MPDLQSRWDVFISHASEDKEGVARPLARMLQQSGLRVWLDEGELQLGDSLRGSIDEALLASRFGVVILSPRFFSKEWTQRELDGLLALESERGKMLLPVMHELTSADVTRYAPSIATRLATSTQRGLSVVAEEILKAVGREHVAKSSLPPGLPLQEPARLVGQQIGAYTLASFVGAGGSGAVFKAAHPKRGAVAVKLFYPLRAELAHLGGLFDRGFFALRALKHPHIVAVIEHGRARIEGAQVPFLVMEFVDGKVLTEWDRGHDRKRGFAARMKVAIDLADALASAHETSYVDEMGFQTRGVFHGDIKPDNVLVTGADDCRLLDFLQIDVQRLIDPRIMGPHVLELDDTGAMGTPGFMAPEQERYGIVTEHTDVFSLGVTLCHLFAPAGACGSNAVLETLQDKALPRALRELLTQMVSDEPSRRAISMREVKARLQKSTRRRFWCR